MLEALIPQEDSLEQAPAGHNPRPVPGTQLVQSSKQLRPLLLPGPGAGAPLHGGSEQPPGSQLPARSPGEPLGNPEDLWGRGYNRITDTPTCPQERRPTHSLWLAYV